MAEMSVGTTAQVRGATKVPMKEPTSAEARAAMKVTTMDAATV